MVTPPPVAIVPPVAPGAIASSPEPRPVEEGIVSSRVVPTTRLALVLLLLSPAVAALVGWGMAAAAVALDLGVVGLAFLSARFAPDARGLVFRRRMDAVLSARVANRIVLAVENDGEEAIRGRLRDEPPPSFGVPAREFALDLAPGARAEFVYEVTPPERGATRFMGTFVRVESPLGLVARQIRWANGEEASVYPNVLALREFDFLNQQGRLREIGIRRARMRGQGSDFESLRDWAEGDDVRRVDWAATARRGKPIVRQYEVERNQLVLLAVDCGRHMLAEVEGVRKLDHVLDAIIMLAHTAAGAGDQVGVLAYSADPVAFVPPMKGRAAMGVVLHALHDLVAEPVESDAVRAFAFLASRVKRRALLVNFTSLADPSRARDVVRGLSPLAHRHLALTVDVADPKLRERLARPIRVADDLAAVAAAQWIERDRREAKGIAQAAGLRTLESEPQDLAAALVNAYLDVKGRGLL